jgi:hypothetical protein
MKTTKRQSTHRYFGMTTTQIGILIAVGATGCSIWAGAFILLTRPQSNQAGLPVQTPSPTQPPVVNENVAPTNMPVATRAPVATKALPAHKLSTVLTDAFGAPHIWLMIVVDKSLSEDDAWALINYYREQYREPNKDFDIDFFCDERYANANSLELRDVDYYARTVYSYNEPYPIGEPRFSANSGEACKSIPNLAVICICLVEGES